MLIKKQVFNKRKEYYNLSEENEFQKIF